ncbi:MAG: hypothetical protein QUS35_12475 [bacterium]|nr:hypothetical protein [bacterium]
MDEKRASDSFSPKNQAQVLVPESASRLQEIDKYGLTPESDNRLLMAFLLRAKGLTYSKMKQN